MYWPGGRRIASSARRRRVHSQLNPSSQASRVHDRNMVNKFFTLLVEALRPARNKRWLVFPGIATFARRSRWRTSGPANASRRRTMR